MLHRKIIRSIMFALAFFAVSLQAQSAMVGTAEMQPQSMIHQFGDLTQQRDWLTEQLITGGVKAEDAKMRVAAMTDSQVQEIHKRIDEHPAGGNAVIIVLLALVITDLLGYTDIFPFIRPAD